MTTVSIMPAQQATWNGPLGRRNGVCGRVDSALFVLNRSSGNGRSADDLQQLSEAFHFYFSSVARRTVAITESHAEVAQRTRAFLRDQPGPWLLLSGGGSGTNRAIVQGLMAEASAGRVKLSDARLSALRLGSGNIVPRHYGTAAEPLAAMRTIADDLYTRRHTSCCVYRCRVQNAARKTAVYGVTMVGVGQLGRIPGDVDTWRRRHPGLMTWLLQQWPLEKVNTGQYLAASFLRALKCILRPRRAEPIVVMQNGQSTPMQLFGGLLINFDFPQLPFRTGCRIDEPRLVLGLIPWSGRWQVAQALRYRSQLDHLLCRYEVTPQQPVSIRFLAQRGSTIAVDEDTIRPLTQVTFEVAGLVNFITGAGPGS